MRNDKAQAKKLRMEGRSYLEIQRALGVPKSTLSAWLSGIVISDTARAKIFARGRRKSIEALVKRNKGQTFTARDRVRKDRAEGEWLLGSISKRDLFTIGAALYWAEGYKRVKIRNGKEVTYHPVSLTNSDPFLVKLFVRFLRECFSVPSEKIKANLRIYKHLNESETKKFWHETSGIRLENFTKSYSGISSASTGKRPFNRLPHGVIQIVVSDTRLFHKIMGAIEQIRNQI